MINTLEGPLSALREREIELLNDISDALVELGDSTSDDRQRLKEIAQDLRDMFFMVSVIGEFNAGKSSFVNAILGEPLLPIGITPTTEYIELIRHGDTPNRIPEVREDGVRVWVHPNTSAPGVAIVDTPGTGSIFQRHEHTAKAFLHRSDLVIFLLSAKHAFAETERMYLELARNYGKKIILVLNQVDLLQPSEQAEVRRFIEAQVKELLNMEPLLFMVSARRALEAGQDAAGDPGGIGAVRAHLRGVYSEAPPARQKLLAQLDTARHVVEKHHADVRRRADLVSLDITKVRDVQQELQQQSLGLEVQMKEAAASIDAILEGIRKRGLNFIDTHLNIRRLGRGLDRDKLQTEFDEVVIGRAVRELREATKDYTDAVIDQSRQYWRGVIDRLNQLRDLLEQEVEALDSSVYAEQRQGLQEAIRIAEAELKSYSTGRVLVEMENVFEQSMSGFVGTGLLTFGGLLTAVLAVLTPGPLIGVAGGVAAAPLALPAFIAGTVVSVVAGVPAYRYYRRITHETRQTFNGRIDQMIQSYHEALDDLTTRERNRLVQYGNQILTPIFGRLEVLGKRYAETQRDLERYLRDIADLRGRINTSK